MKYLLLLACLMSPLSMYAQNAGASHGQLCIKAEISIDEKIQECRETLQKHSENNEAVLEMFDETVAEWQYYAETEQTFDLQSLLKAIVFAAEKHEGQYRDGPARVPYIIHPIGVAHSLFVEGQVRSVNVLIAALLHDTLEDTETTVEEIEALFGPRVRYTVEELTDDPLLSSQERKQKQVEHAPYMSLNAQLVKLADRLYNIRDMKDVDWPKSNKLRYLAWGEKLLSALRGTNEALELALEEEIFDQLLTSDDL